MTEKRDPGHDEMWKAGVTSPLQNMTPEELAAYYGKMAHTPRWAQRLQQAKPEPKPIVPRETGPPCYLCRRRNMVRVGPRTYFCQRCKRGTLLALHADGWHYYGVQLKA